MPGKDLRYPIGKFVQPTTLSPEARRIAISRIAKLPVNLSNAAEHVGHRIDEPYRPGGWTGRQVVHHVADSHVNAWIRMRLGLTEVRPTIRPYEEQAWAMLPDYARPFEESLALITALHARWDVLLNSITEDQWQRQVVHPEAGVMTMDDLLANYAWHGDHHVAHIRQILEQH